MINLTIETFKYNMRYRRDKKMYISTVLKELFNYDSYRKYDSLKHFSMSKMDPDIGFVYSTHFRERALQRANIRSDRELRDFRTRFMDALRFSAVTVQSTSETYITKVKVPNEGFFSGNSTFKGNEYRAVWSIEDGKIVLITILLFLKTSQAKGMIKKFLMEGEENDVCHAGPPTPDHTYLDEFRN